MNPHPCPAPAPRAARGRRSPPAPRRARPGLRQDQHDDHQRQHDPDDDLDRGRDDRDHLGGLQDDLPGRPPGRRRQRPDRRHADRRRRRLRQLHRQLSAVVPREAIYKGATRPAMKFGIPLVPLVVLFGTGMLRHPLGRRARQLVDRRRRRSPPSCRRSPGCASSTAQGRSALPADLRRRQAAPARPQPPFWRARSYSPTLYRGAQRCLARLASSRPPATGVLRRGRVTGRAPARENPLARFVPFSSLAEPARRRSRAAATTCAVWRLDGVPFECADDSVIAERHEAICSLLRNLAGGQWAVWSHRLHRVVQRHDEHAGRAGLRARALPRLLRASSQAGA